MSRTPAGAPLRSYTSQSGQTSRRGNPILPPDVKLKASPFANFLAAIMNASLSSGKLVIPPGVTLPFTFEQLPLRTVNCLVDLPENGSFHVYNVEYFDKQLGYGFAVGRSAEKPEQPLHVQFHASRYEKPELKLIPATHDNPQATLALISTKPKLLDEEVRPKDQRKIRRHDIPMVTSGQMLAGIAVNKPRPNENKHHLIRWLLQEEYYAALQQYNVALSRSGELFTPYRVELQDPAKEGLTILVQTTSFISAIHAYRSLFPFIGKDQFSGLEQRLTLNGCYPIAIELLVSNYAPCGISIHA